MYIPRSFRIDDIAVIESFIQDYNFGTLFSQHFEDAMATPLPFLINKGTERYIYAHFARANPHWKQIKEDREVLVTFAGPHTYISPDWYRDKETVPTWNYTMVQVRGTCTLIHDTGELRNMADALTHHHEKEAGSGWAYEDYADYRDRLLPAIVGIKVNMEHVTAKFKLNQNRSAGDRSSVIEHLEASASATDRAVAECMRRHASPDSSEQEQEPDPDTT